MFKATDFYHEPWRESGEGLTAAQRVFLNERKAKRKAKNGKRR